jgi:hypothetical protein
MSTRISSNGVTSQNTSTGLSPFTGTFQAPTQGRSYARGTGGVTDLCTLYGFEPFNPCGGPARADCDFQWLYIAIIIAILALLWLQPAPGSE